MQSSFLGYELGHFLYRLGTFRGEGGPDLVHVLTHLVLKRLDRVESDLVPEPIHELELHVAPRRYRRCSRRMKASTALPPSPKVGRAPMLVADM